MIRALALDLASRGITSYCVAPGWVATRSQAPEEALAALQTRSGDSGTPGEIAAAIALVAMACASYITGEMIVVDRGNCLQERKA